MKNQDWRLKYLDLKTRFQDSVDASYRLGIEMGMQQAQMQQAQQAQAQAEQAAAAAQGQMPGQPGQPGQDPQMDQSNPNAAQTPSGSELDQHINQLESMVQKSSPTDSGYQELKKSLDGIKAFQAQLKQTYEMKKANEAINAIGKAMKTPFTIGKQASKNMSPPAQKALNMQEDLVKDIMKGWAEEEAYLASSVTKTLDFESLLKE